MSNLSNGGKFNTIWYAIKEKDDWDKNEQHELYGLSWNEAFKKAKEIAKANKKEVRLSTSKGYNNQGHYIYFEYEDGGVTEMAETELEIGENINVFGYQTEHFVQSHKAVSEFKKAIEQILSSYSIESLEYQKESEALSKAAQHLDNIFKLENSLNEKGIDDNVTLSEIMELNTSLKMFYIYNYKSGLRVNSEFLGQILYNIFDVDRERDIEDKVLTEGELKDEINHEEVVDIIEDNPVTEISEEETHEEVKEEVPIVEIEKSEDEQIADINEAIRLLEMLGDEINQQAE